MAMAEGRAPDVVPFRRIPLEEPAAGASERPPSTACVRAPHAGRRSVRTKDPQASRRACDGRTSRHVPGPVPSSFPACHSMTWKCTGTCRAAHRKAEAGQALPVLPVRRTLTCAHRAQAGTFRCAHHGTSSRHPPSARARALEIERLTLERIQESALHSEAAFSSSQRSAAIMRCVRPASIPFITFTSRSVPSSRPADPEPSVEGRAGPQRTRSRACAASGAASAVRTRA